jgi:hypothetical protein
VEELKKREQQPSMLFDDQEIDAVFRMADLMQVGSVTAKQAKQALQSMVRVIIFW